MILSRTNFSTHGEYYERKESEQTIMYFLPLKDEEFLHTWYALRTAPVPDSNRNVYKKLMKQIGHYEFRKDGQLHRNGSLIFSKRDYPYIVSALEREKQNVTSDDRKKINNVLSSMKKIITPNSKTRKTTTTKLPSNSMLNRNAFK